MSDESLVVVISKLKKTVKKMTGCSLSMEAIGILNQKMIDMCVDAARYAQNDRRKIIKARDVM